MSIQRKTAISYSSQVGGCFQGIHNKVKCCFSHPSCQLAEWSISTWASVPGSPLLRFHSTVPVWLQRRVIQVLRHLAQLGRVDFRRIQGLFLPLHIMLWQTTKKVFSCLMTTASFNSAISYQRTASTRTLSSLEVQDTNNIGSRYVYWYSYIVCYPTSPLHTLWCGGC